MLTSRPCWLDGGGLYPDRKVGDVVVDVDCVVLRGFMSLK